MEPTGLLSVEDIIVVAICLFVPLCKGVVFAVKERVESLKNRVLPGERITTLTPVTIAIFATYMSPVSLMGSPTDIYTFGGMFFANHIGFGIAFIIGSFTVVPLLHPLGITSLFEYLEKRYNSIGVRHFFVVITVIMTMFFMGVSSLPPTFGLEVGAGLSFLSSLATVVLVATLYTLIGGLKSYVITDSFLISLMFLAFVVYIASVTQMVGGGTSALVLAQAGGRTDFSEINPDPRVRHSWWGTIIGGTTYWLFTACSQANVRNLSGVKSITSAQLALVINGALVVIFGAFILGFGLIMYAFLHFQYCDPLKVGLIKNRNHTPPFFVLTAMKDFTGLPGIFFSALFSSSLYTLCSGINFMASNTTDDILKSRLSKYSQRSCFLVNKCCVLAFGLVILATGYVANFMTGTLVQKLITVIGAFGSPLTGAFLLGAVTSKANKYGAVCGGAASVMVNLWIVVGANVYGRRAQPLPGPPSEMCFINSTISYAFSLVNNSSKSSTNYVTSMREDGFDPYGFTFFVYDISYVWYSVLGVLVCVVVGLVVSIGTARYVRDEPNPVYIFYIFRRQTAVVRDKMCDVAGKKLESRQKNFGTDHTKDWVEQKYVFGVQNVIEVRKENYV